MADSFRCDFAGFYKLTTKINANEELYLAVA